MDDTGTPHTMKRIGLWAGLVVFVTLLVLTPYLSAHPEPVRMAALALLMILWWTTEAVPLATTSLLPLVLLPSLGILQLKEISGLYFNSTILMFVGGFVLSLAMQRWNLHKRLALKMILIAGHSPARIILGFMMATSFVSMWSSNTSTTLMMFPVALALIHSFEEQWGKKSIGPFATALMLAVGYSATLGGLATIIGTPPNLAFRRIFEQTFPQQPSPSFGQWMLLGVPIALLLLVFTWIALTRFLFRMPQIDDKKQSVVKQEYKALGRFSREEIIISGVFLVTIFLWIFRADMVLGSWTLPGWARLLPAPVNQFADDGIIAIAMSLLLFVFPGREKNTSLIDGTIFQQIPWGIVLLFGGGFALARGLDSSGLSHIIGSQFKHLQTVHPLLILFGVALVITLFSEVASNISTVEIFLPILASVSLAIGMSPLLLMLCGTFASSMGFMLPMATAPNAIVFSSQRIRMSQMVRAGFFLDVAGVLIVTLALWILGPLIFGVPLKQP